MNALISVAGLALSGAVIVILFVAIALWLSKVGEKWTSTTDEPRRCAACRHWNRAGFPATEWGECGMQDDGLTNCTSTCPRWEAKS